MDVTLVFASILVVLLIYYLTRKKTQNGGSIPGPKGLPVCGSLFEFKLGDLHNLATKYAREYGEIFQLKIFHENIVFLNTADLIRKAYTDERYKRQLNDRPVTFYGEHFQYGSKGLIMNKHGYSPKHAELRKHFAKGLKAYGDGVKAFEDIISEEILDMMRVIDKHEGEEFEFLPVLERSLSNLLSILMCGEKRVTGEHVDLFWEYIDAVNYAGTPRFDSIMKVFPFIRYLPGPYGRACQRLEQLVDKLIHIFLRTQKETYEAGKIRGLMDYLISEQQRELAANHEEPLMTDEMLFALIADIVLAGLITTRAALANMFFCLMHHPQYQIKLQAEIDNVIGTDRLPTLNDRNNMPFTEAVAMESQRYLTTGVVMAHLSNDDVNFEGYFIKKNTFLFPNMWYIHHDEKIWGDPWVFRPERFLDDNGKLLPLNHPTRQAWLIFGAGRRHCIGESLARTRMFLYMTSLLQKFTILPSENAPTSCDPRGDDVDVKIVTTPKPFKCRLLPRKLVCRETDV